MASLRNSFSLYRYDLLQDENEEAEVSSVEEAPATSTEEAGETTVEDHEGTAGSEDAGESLLEDAEKQKLAVSCITPAGGVCRHYKAGGLRPATAVMIVVGALAGLGEVVLPDTLGLLGWFGLILTTSSLFFSGYTGILLGRCWGIMLERYPDIGSKQIRNPYALIGEMAMGKWMGVTVSIANNGSLFGASVLLVVLVAENMRSVLKGTTFDVTFCLWLVIVVIILTPLTWPDTPKDLWVVGVFGTVTSVLAFILIMVSMFMELPHKQREPEMTKPTVINLFTACNVLLFATSGHGVYPSLQQDLKDHRKFSRVIIYSHTAFLGLYLPLAILAYYIYGAEVGHVILTNLPKNGIRMAAELCITGHCITSLLMALNTVAQDIEAHSFFIMPDGISWKRCLLRTLVMIALLFVAETIPHFGALLHLIGASLLAFTSAVAPCLFYLCLCSQRGDWPDRSLPLYVKVVCIQITVIGIFLAVAGTYTAMKEIVSPDSFILPCYINPSQE